MNEQRRRAEWFDQEPLVSKEANGLIYEVWANGTFATTSPDGDKFKGHDSAQAWLFERGITNDEQLNSVCNNEDGWETDMTRWFDLIVFTPHNEGWTELYYLEPEFEYDEEGFKEWIDGAIEEDSTEE
jgi:hypothetical protein